MNAKKLAEKIMADPAYRDAISEIVSLFVIERDKLWVEVVSETYGAVTANEIKREVLTRRTG